MKQEEAIEGLLRVQGQKAKLASEIENPIHRFMKPAQRDPTEREIEAKEKSLAILWLAIELQETVKSTMVKSGISQETIDNAIKLFRKEAKT